MRLGARRIGFLGYSNSARTHQAPARPYRQALAEYEVKPNNELVWKENAKSADLVAAVRQQRIQGFVCGNDRMAGELMHKHLADKIRIPGDVRIVGMDDVIYASLLPVPVTTIHQLCRETGETALRAMLERLDRPKTPARDVLLDCHLVVRASCGGAIKR